MSGLSETLSDQEFYLQNLDNISTIDGRESLRTRPLRQYLSEGALHRYRAVIEIDTLIALSDSKLASRPQINQDERVSLRGLVARGSFNPVISAQYDHFGRNGTGPLEHDVKAGELNLREGLDLLGMPLLKEWVHFPMTSEDTNNLAWNLMIRDGINNVWLPKTLEVGDKLADFSTRFAHVPVLGKTHGMDASPTTFGKRFSYTLGLMANILEQMAQLTLNGKFSGAVGNDNAITAVAPDFNFKHFAKEFVESYGFKYIENANQRNPHLDTMRVLHEIKLMNMVGADFCENIRHSVMMKWLLQIGQESHVGSSVMPNKINPWFFEVGQGYFEQSSTQIDGAATGLIPSVFERDLTDHPYERAYGEMIAKSLVGLSYVSEGLDTLRVDDEAALKELQTTPPVLSEAVQIAGRIAGVYNIYMTIKHLTRGRPLDQATLHKIIEENIPEGDLRTQLLVLKPETYIGKAPEIALNTVTQYTEVRSQVERGILDDSTKIKAVLFDFDGTLQVGDKDELFARLTEISTRLNLDFSIEEIKLFANRSDYREIRQLMVESYNSSNRGTILTEDQFQGTNNEVTGMFDDRFKLAEDVEEVLDNLQKVGKKIGIVTTRGTNSLTRVLQKYGLTDAFDVIVSRDDIQRRKPHPEPIAVALEKLSITDPSQVVYVGDLQEDDIIAGNAIGVKTILVSTQPLDPYGAKPTYHFDNLQPIIRHFGR